MDKILSLLGLAKKAGRVEAGEDAVAAAAAAHRIRLLITAEDAAENSLRRARRFADLGDCLTAELPVSKERLGGAVGMGSCAMLALTDLGFAGAVGKSLSELNGERWGELSRRLEIKARRAKERREKRGKTGKTGGKRPAGRFGK